MEHNKTKTTRAIYTKFSQTDAQYSKVYYIKIYFFSNKDVTLGYFHFPCIDSIILSNLRSVKHSPEWYNFAYLNFFIKVFQNSCWLITKQPLNANIKQNNNFNTARSHFGDDATKYPLRTPWYWRHGKRELFPARLSTMSRPWFAIIIALSKSLAWHSSFVAELGPEKSVVPSTTCSQTFLILTLKIDLYYTSIINGILMNFTHLFPIKWPL